MYIYILDIWSHILRKGEWEITAIMIPVHRSTLTQLISLSKFVGASDKRYFSLYLRINEKSKSPQSGVMTDSVIEDTQNGRDKVEEEDTGYMKRRLEQLKEDSYSPSSSLDFQDDIESFESEAKSEPGFKLNEGEELHQLIDRISNQDLKDVTFDKQYQREIEMARMPEYLKSNKHARDIATGKVWTGTESQYEASYRMLNDVYKPLKIKSKVGSTSTTKANTLFTPKVTLKERVHNAREGALDYQISKISEKKSTMKEDEEDDGFKEMYRERLLGPAQFLNDSFASVDNSIKSIADQKIMESQRRGDFENLSIRGKPLPKGYSSDGTLIDRTTYHLNNIMKSQDAIPPWIEKQGSVAVQVKFFRSQLDSDWRKKAILLIDEETKGKTVEEKLKVAQMYADNEVNDKSPKLRSQEWITHEASYLKAKINSLNDSLRGYNLQAPLASQKLYLVPEKELNATYQRVSGELVSALERHLLGEGKDDAEHRKAIKPRGSGMMKYGDLHQRDLEEIYQVPSESLGSMFLNLFKSDKGNGNKV